MFLNHCIGVKVHIFQEYDFKNPVQHRQLALADYPSAKYTNQRFEPVLNMTKES